ncbi:MAG: hypothetical protein ACWA5P_05035 [bacterium]
MKMNKISTLLLMVCAVVFSCDELDELTEFDISDNFSTTVNVSVSEASDQPQTFSETATLDIGANQEIQDNADLIQGISINSLTYEIANYTGIENATLSNASLNFGSTSISIDDINLPQSDTDGTIYTISNSQQLSAIASALANSQSITITASGTLSGSPVDFDVIINVDLTVTIDVL